MAVAAIPPTPIAKLVATLPPPNPTLNPRIKTSLLNVLVPANVCALVVTIPPYVASAGANINELPEDLSALSVAS